MERISINEIRPEHRRPGCAGGEDASRMGVRGNRTRGTPKSVGTCYRLSDVIDWELKQLIGDKRDTA
jgi:hypothetical protein